MSDELGKIFVTTFASGLSAGFSIYAYLDGEKLGAAILAVITVLLWVASIKLCERHGER